MDTLPDKDRQVKKRKLPEFLREEKPLGINKKQWKRLVEKSGFTREKQRLLKEYSSGKRQWPQWTMLVLNRDDIPDEEIARVLLSLANPSEDKTRVARDTPYAPSSTLPVNKERATWLKVRDVSVILLLSVSVIFLWYFLMSTTIPHFTHPSQSGAAQFAVPSGVDPAHYIPLYQCGGPLTSTVYTGSKLSWRELERWDVFDTQTLGSSGRAPVVSVIDADGDADQEILAQYRRDTWQTTGMLSTTTGSEMVLTIFETGGRSRQLKNPGYAEAVRVFAWDFTGDGLSELVVPNEPAWVTEIYDLTGNYLHTIQALTADSIHMMTPQQTGDFDGDGLDEILLMDVDYRGLAAYGNGGIVDWRPVSFIQYMLAIPCDIDGDGIPELVDLTPPLKAFGINLPGDGLPLPGVIPSGPAAHSPWTTAADLDGDGCDELIIPERGFLNPVTGVYTPFDWSVKVNRFAKTPRNPAGGTYDWGHRMAVGDFTGSGSLEVAVTATADSPPPQVRETMLCIFDASGTAIHCEMFDALIWDVTAVHAQNRDYLAVILSDRLLIYP